MNYLLQKFAVHESLPNVDIEFPELPRDRSVRVYSDVEQVQDHLSDPRFEHVSSVDDADVVWTKHYLKDFKYVLINYTKRRRLVSFLTFSLCGFVAIYLVTSLSDCLCLNSLHLCLSTFFNYAITTK